MHVGMLRRPDLRVRRRVPFRSIRRNSVLVAIVLVIGNARVRCVPDRQPDPCPAFSGSFRTVSDDLVLEAAVRMR